jgi:hypothetical protein
VVARLAPGGPGGANPIVAAICEALDERASAAGNVDEILRLLVGRAPMILIVDGLEAADLEAVQAFEELEHGCRGTGIAIVARYRAEDPLDADPLRRLNPSAIAQIGRSRLLVAGDPLRTALQSAMVSLSFLVPLLGLLSDIFDDLT